MHEPGKGYEQVQMSVSVVADVLAQVRAEVAYLSAHAKERGKEQLPLLAFQQEPGHTAPYGYTSASYARVRVRLRECDLQRTLAPRVPRE